MLRARLFAYVSQPTAPIHVGLCSVTPVFGAAETENQDEQPRNENQTDRVAAAVAERARQFVVQHDVEHKRRNRANAGKQRTDDAADGTYNAGRDDREEEVPEILAFPADFVQDILYRI